MLSEEDRIEVGQLIAKCDSLAERKQLREELTELFECTHQAISAASIWHNRKNHIPIDTDIDEWIAKREKYSGDNKSESRDFYMAWIRNGFDSFEDLKVVCLPGVMCYEIPLYLELGIKPQNIVGIERDERDYQLMQYEAKRYGIRTFKGSIAQFNKQNDELFNIINFDYLGQLCEGSLRDIRNVKKARRTMLITNFWCRRELGKIQHRLDEAAKDAKASYIAHQNRDHYFDFNSLSQMINSEQLQDNRGAIPYLIMNEFHDCVIEEPKSFLQTVSMIEKFMTDPRHTYFLDIARIFMGEDYLDPQFNTFFRDIYYTSAVIKHDAAYVLGCESKIYQSDDSDVNSIFCTTVTLLEKPDEQTPHYNLVRALAELLIRGIKWKETCHWDCIPDEDQEVRLIGLVQSSPHSRDRVFGLPIEKFEVALVELIKVVNHYRNRYTTEFYLGEVQVEDYKIAETSKPLPSSTQLEKEANKKIRRKIRKKRQKLLRKTK